MLVETHLPVRYYIPPQDVRMDLLGPSTTRSACAYKGHASYLSTVDGSEAGRDIAWVYPDPLDDAARVRDHLAFWNERTDLVVDGEEVPRPVTPWSRPEEQSLGGPRHAGVRLSTATASPTRRWSSSSAPPARASPPGPTERYRREEIVSSDALRGVVGSGPHDLDASADAFALLETIVAARLGRGLCTVVDTLGTDPDRRLAWLAAGRAAGLPTVAVLLATPEAECRRRNAARDRPVPAPVLAGQLRAVRDVDDRAGRRGLGRRRTRCRPPPAPVARRRPRPAPRGGDRPPYVPGAWRWCSRSRASRGARTRRPGCGRWPRPPTRPASRVSR